MIALGDSVQSVFGGEVFEVEAVCPFLPMVKIGGGWSWVEGLVLVSAAPAKDPIEEQLKWLGL